MPADREPDQLTTSESDQPYAGLKAELEALRERQQRLEQEYPPQDGGEKEPEQNQKPQDDQKPDTKEATPEAKKTPLRKRLLAFPRTHPIGFLITLVLVAAGLVGLYFLWQYFDSY
jgi:hypothetical protein